MGMITTPCLVLRAKPHHPELLTRRFVVCPHLGKFRLSLIDISRSGHPMGKKIALTR